jgi:hypothetical protein
MRYSNASRHVLASLRLPRIVGTGVLALALSAGGLATLGVTEAGATTSATLALQGSAIAGYAPEYVGTMVIPVNTAPTGTLTVHLSNPGTCQSDSWAYVSPNGNGYEYQATCSPHETEPVDLLPV